VKLCVIIGIENKFKERLRMKYPKYIKTSDGYIGTFQYLEFGEFPVYRFEGGDRVADNWELANGSDNREDLISCAK
jgi:hypothetical protein